MSFLKSKLIFDVSKRALSSSSGLRAAWNKDWRPADLPKNEAERLAAAKKYNLLPEEYTPTADDGYGAGDYPEFKPYSVESRDPFYPWDYPEYRRNYGEPIADDIAIHTEDRYDVNMRPRYSLPAMLAMYIGVMGTFYFLYATTENTCFWPKAARHFPEPGKKHYTYSGTHAGHSGH